EIVRDAASAICRVPAHSYGVQRQLEGVTDAAARSVGRVPAHGVVGQRDGAVIRNSPAGYVGVVTGHRDVVQGQCGSIVDTTPVRIQPRVSLLNRQVGDRGIGED